MRGASIFNDAVADRRTLSRPLQLREQLAVGLRTISHAAAAALIVLRLSKPWWVPNEVIYNGALERVVSVDERGRTRLPFSPSRESSTNRDPGSMEDVGG